MALHVPVCMYVLVVRTCKLTLTVLVAASVSSAWRPAQTYKAKLALFSKLVPWINSWVFKMLWIIKKRQVRAAHTILEEGKVKVKTITSPIFFLYLDWNPPLKKQKKTKKRLAQIAVLNTPLQLFPWSSLFTNDSVKWGLCPRTRKVAVVSPVDPWYFAASFRLWTTIIRALRGTMLPIVAAIIRVLGLQLWCGWALSYSNCIRPWEWVCHRGGAVFACMFGILSSGGGSALSSCLCSLQCWM